MIVACSWLYYTIAPPNFEREAAVVNLWHKIERFNFW
jgi:hypothetical protein